MAPGIGPSTRTDTKHKKNKNKKRPKKYQAQLMDLVSSLHDYCAPGGT